MGISHSFAALAGAAVGRGAARGARDRRLHGRVADAVVAGRYRVDRPGTQPLRASANQQLILTGPRARERYTDLRDQDGELQAVFDDRGLTMLGLPRVGDLPRMERALRARGVTLSEVSWRP